MACANPWLYRVNPRKNPTHLPLDRVYTCPCGKCLNCRVDRKTMWSDRAKYALKEFGCGTFLTLTYSDHMIRCICRDDVLKKSDVDGQTRYNLYYPHVQNFLYRLRSEIKYNEKKTGIKDSGLRSDFKFICTGEYGEQNGRCHFHLLVFGLDFARAKSLYKRNWIYGFIESRPILNGGIAYVLKYIDKMVTGDQKYQLYTQHGITAPKQVQSNSLGVGLYSKSHINSDDWTYPVGRGKSRPIPRYWKDKFLASIGYETPQADVLRNIRSEMRRYDLHDFSSGAVQQFLKFRTELRERSMLALCRRDPKYMHIPDVLSSIEKKQPAILHRFTDTQLRYAQQEYIDRLNEKFLNS